MRAMYPIDSYVDGKLLGSVLGCDVKPWWCVQNDHLPAYGVKVLVCHVFTAIKNGRKNRWFVDVWRPVSESGSAGSRVDNNVGEDVDENIGESNFDSAEKHCPGNLV